MDAARADVAAGVARGEVRKVCACFAHEAMRTRAVRDPLRSERIVTEAAIAPRASDVAHVFDSSNG